MTQFTEDQYGTNNTLRSLAQSEIVLPKGLASAQTIGSFGYKERHTSSLHGGLSDNSIFKTEVFPNALLPKKGKIIFFDFNIFLS